MKKTDKFLSAVVLTAVALCASCSTDELAEQQQGQNETKAVSLTATLNEVQTRAGMSKGTADNTATFYWHNKDAILVQTKTSDNTYPGAQFITTEETGATVAVFWGEPLSGVTLGTYAVYPYNKKHAFTSETALTYNLPASYTYTTVDNGIFSKAEDGATTYRTNSTNIPMYGKIADGSVAFQYLGGVAVIRIDQMPYTSGTLTVTADQKLCGNFEIADLSADKPEIATTSTETDSEKQVAFTFSGATDGGVGVFYLPLATGEYTNLAVKINDTVVECGSVSISCAGVTAISIATYEGTLTAYTGQLLRSYGSNRYYLGDNMYLINDHEFVDLGLSVLWATMNVGATTAADTGNYYAWGETATKENYEEAYYDSSLNSRYPTEGATLEASDDAATALWGTSCRMPTPTEFNELNNTDNCTWDWTTQSPSSGSDISGYKVTSVKNGSTIFLPASGYYISNSNSWGTEGYYWANSRYIYTVQDGNLSSVFNEAHTFKITNISHELAWAHPNVGLPVRAVAAKPTVSE